VPFLLTRAVSVVVLVWSLLSVVAAWRAATTRGADPVAALETEFRTLARSLPSSGPVGFLPYAVDEDRADRVMTYYVAQYALAPRVVERRTDLEFVIVARDALRPGVDQRIAGFVPIASSRDGHRLYQRRTP
jgi:hypothetical protein